MPAIRRKITGKSNDAGLPMSPSIRGKRVSSIRMPSGLMLRRRSRRLRPLLLGAARLLVPARQPHHPEIVEPPARDLQADRLAFLGVAAVDRRRRLLAHVER